MIVSAESIQAAGLDGGDMEARTLQLKGRREPVDVLVIRMADG